MSRMQSRMPRSVAVVVVPPVLLAPLVLLVLLALLGGRKRERLVDCWSWRESRRCPFG